MRQRVKQMATEKTPRQWLIGHKTATTEDLSNDIWIRIERTNRMLEKYGRGDFIANMPVLFAMYYDAAVTLMQIPEDPVGMDLQRIFLQNVRDLEQECLIEPEEMDAMVDHFHHACQSIAEACMEGKQRDGEKFNPFGAVVTATAKLLELSYSDIHIELANYLADFLVSYRLGDAPKKHPLKS